MMKKFFELAADPEMWIEFVILLIGLAMFIPGPAGVMFGSLALALVFLFIAVCVGLTLFGRAGGLLALWGGLILYAFAFGLRAFKFLTCWTPP